jgi:hypothetical protein
MICVPSGQCSNTLVAVYTTTKSPKLAVLLCFLMYHTLIAIQHVIIYLYHVKRPYFQEESSGSSDFKDTFRRSGIVAVRNISTTVQMLADVCKC